MTQKIFIILLTSLVLVPVLSFAHELDCQITPFPYNFDEFVTGKEFSFTMEFKNKETAFPGARADVVITSPEGKVGSVSFDVPEMNKSAQNFSWYPPWWRNASMFAIYPMNKSGDWKIEALLNAKDGNEIILNSEGMKYVNKCYKTFPVMEYGEYQKLKVEKEKIAQEKEKQTPLIIVPGEKQGLTSSERWMVFFGLVGLSAFVRRLRRRIILWILISLVIAFGII